MGVTLKKLGYLIFLSLIIFTSVVHAAPGNLDGALDITWANSPDEVREIMRSRAEKKVIDVSNQIENVSYTIITYATSYAGNNALIYFNFFNDKLFDITAIIPAKDNSPVNIYKQVSQAIAEQYGPPDLASGTGLASKKSWIFSNDDSNQINLSIKRSRLYNTKPGANKLLYSFYDSDI
jgi:hypothetical protein